MVHLFKTLVCGLLSVFSPLGGVSSYRTEPRDVQFSDEYSKALGASIQFYEAQRSGKLPNNNRISWRGDSFLNDKTDGGKCITGGFFDAGDNVKFLLPFGWTVTVLAWGADVFRQGYEKAGLTQQIRDVLRWAGEFAMSAYVSDVSVVGSVGDGDADHAQWKRPEDISQPSTVYMLSPSSPGSDVAGSLASALASISIVFARVDADFARRALRTAAALYRFGDKYRGRYSDSIPSAGKFYKSSSYHDELAWAAAMIWKSSRNTRYRDAAMQHLRDYLRENGVPWNNFDWDSAYWGALSVLKEHDRSMEANVTAFVNAWKKGTDGVTYTPRGLAWSFEWGSLRENANALFYAMVNDDGKGDTSCWVKKQADYILGLSGGRSFVVGIGKDSPCRPHHRGASCRDSSCSWNDFNSPGCNPNVITGALVGGPGKDDGYVDARSDFQKNEVAIDYNAGWTSALAALVQRPCAAGGQRNVSFREKMSLMY